MTFTNFMNSIKTCFLNVINNIPSLITDIISNNFIKLIIFITILLLIFDYLDYIYVIIKNVFNDKSGVD